MQLLFTGGFGKEQWDSYPIPDAIFNFLLFPNLFSLRTFLPHTSLYIFQKYRGLMSLALISVILLAPGFLSSSPIVQQQGQKCSGTDWGQVAGQEERGCLLMTSCARCPELRTL